MARRDAADVIAALPAQQVSRAKLAAPATVQVVRAQGMGRGVPLYKPVKAQTTKAVSALDRFVKNLSKAHADQRVSTAVALAHHGDHHHHHAEEEAADFQESAQDVPFSAEWHVPREDEATLMQKNRGKLEIVLSTANKGLTLTIDPALQAKIEQGLVRPVIEYVNVDHFHANTTPTHLLSIKGLKARAGEPGFGSPAGDVAVGIPASLLGEMDGHAKAFELLPSRSYKLESLSMLQMFAGFLSNPLAAIKESVHEYPEKGYALVQPSTPIIELYNSDVHDGEYVNKDFLHAPDPDSWVNMPWESYAKYKQQALERAEEVKNLDLGSFAFVLSEQTPMNSATGKPLRATFFRGPTAHLDHVTSYAGTMHGTIGLRLLAPEAGKTEQ